MRRLDQCIEHCLQIERRPADDFEHVGGSSLLLTSLVQLALEQGDILLFGDRATRPARRTPPMRRGSCGGPPSTVLGHERATCPTPSTLTQQGRWWRVAAATTSDMNSRGFIP